MSGCQLLPERQIEIQTNFVHAEPVLLPIPKPPVISHDPVIVITAEEAQFYSDACQDIKDGQEIDGLDHASACDWVVMGLTVQGWYNLQQNLLIIQNYVERLKEQRDFYERQLVNRHDAQNN